MSAIRVPYSIKIIIYAMNHQNTAQLMEIFIDLAKHQNRLLYIYVCINHNHYIPSNVCSAYALFSTNYSVK